MARKMVTMLEDDIDGGEAIETVSFSLDGVAYEIDLNANNAARLRDEFAPWVGAARRAGRGATRTAVRSARAARPRAGKSDLSGVREWARGQGLQVSERGRISADVQQAYDAAH
ncbi:MAG TPA: Lsr2 family protein [Mycobacteriales bacterium]|jgi:hypothetical protein|nr:Lsr2 family protein [Mycobacteriales bacterium]